MQEASDAHSKTADSDTVSTYQVFFFTVKINAHPASNLFTFTQGAIDVSTVWACTNGCLIEIQTKKQIFILNIIYLDQRG